MHKKPWSLWFICKEAIKMEGTIYNHKGLLKGFLLGGLLGATAGILFAPQGGKELRSGVKSKGEKVLKETKEFYSDTKARAETMYENARHRIFACGRKESQERSFRNIESPEEIAGEA
jgi:gas vesicle protein